MGRTIESIKHDLRIQAGFECSNAGHGFIYGSINRALFRNISFGRRLSEKIGPPKSRRDSEKHNFHDKFIRSQERFLSCCVRLPSKSFREFLSLLLLMVFLEMLFSKLSDDGTNYQVRIMKRIPFSGSVSILQRDNQRRLENYLPIHLTVDCYGVVLFTFNVPFLCLRRGIPKISIRFPLSQKTKIVFGLWKLEPQGSWT